MRRFIMLVTGLLLAVLPFTPHGLLAQNEDMLQEDVRQLLANPLRMYSRFNTRHLYPLSNHVDMVQAKLEEALRQTEDPETIAVLQYLLEKAEASRFIGQKHRRFREIRNQRMTANKGEKLSREEVEKISAQVDESMDESGRFVRLPAMIAALNKLPAKPLVNRLRNDMQRSINALLERAKPGRLPEETRKIVISEYVKADYDPLASFDADKTVVIYRNLQLDAELKRLCETPPKEVEKLEDLLRRIKLAEAAGTAGQAVAFADELYARLEGMSAMEAERWIYELAEDYARLKPEAALEKFKDKTQDHSRVYISLYRASCRINQFGDEARRCREWLLPCLEMQKANIDKEKAYRAKNKDNRNLSSPESHFYGLIFQEFDRYNEYAPLFFVADYILALPGMEKDRFYGYILYRKGLALSKLGKKEEARRTLQACLDCEATEASLKSYVYNELERLVKKDEQ